MPFRDTAEPYVVPEPSRPSRVVFLPGESQEEYAVIRELWMREYHAGTEPFEYEVAERIVDADWRRHRLLGQLNRLEAHLFSTIGDLSEWKDEHFKRYTQAQRLYASALREVETLRRQLNQQKLSRFRQICVEFQAALVVVKHRELRRQAARQKAARKPANPTGDNHGPDNQARS
jgi:hypothetical protein